VTMTICTQPVCPRHNIVATNFLEGGDDSLHAETVVRENGFALRFPRNRIWLQGVISDPMSHVFDRDKNAFVRKARSEIGVSLRIALALFSLFEIRGSEFLDDALARYEQETREDQEEPE